MIRKVYHYQKKITTWFMVLNRVGWNLEVHAITSPPYPPILPIFQPLILPATGANTRVKTGCVCHVRTSCVAVLWTSICSTIPATLIIMWPSASVISQSGVSPAMLTWMLNSFLNCVLFMRLPIFSNLVRLRQFHPTNIFPLEIIINPNPHTCFMFIYYYTSPCIICFSSSFGHDFYTRNL